MFPRAGSFGNIMCTVRIFHELKGLVVFNQLIQQHLRIIEVNVIIPAAMYIEQIPLKPGGIGNRGALYIVCLGFQRVTHISFLVNVIVRLHVVQPRNGKPGFINFRMLKHQVQGS